MSILRQEYFQNKYYEYHMEFFKKRNYTNHKIMAQNGCKESPEDIFDIIKSEYQGRTQAKSNLSTEEYQKR